MMSNPVEGFKVELIEWIEHLDDLQILSNLIKIKNQSENTTEILETDLMGENHFCQHFAAGITSDEFSENVAAHIEWIARVESVSHADIEGDYPMKDDVDEKIC